MVALKGMVSLKNVMVSLIKFSWIWAFFIADFENNNGMLESKMSVLILILSEPIMPSIVVDSKDLSWLLSPNQKVL